MLAITGLPTTVGNQFGAPIVLATDGNTPNSLTITLDDVSNAGWVTATINGNKYFNFNNTISFTGTFDTDGSIDNQVVITTPFGLDLGNGANKFAWNSVCDFTPAGLTDIQVNLVNADGLTIKTTGGSAAGGPSSIVGTFDSPTLAPPPGATINFQSHDTITVLPGGVTTHALTLDSQLNGVPSALIFQGPVNVNANLTISSTSALSIDQPLAAVGGIALTSRLASLRVNQPVRAAGAITLTSAADLTIDAAVESTLQSVTLTAGTELRVNQDVTANTFVTATGKTGILTDAAADLLATTGGVTLTSASGFVRAAGSLSATAGSISITTTKASGLDVVTATVSALTGFTVAANTAVTLAGPTTITGDGSLAVTAGTDAILAGVTRVLGNGGVTINANNDLTFSGPTTLFGLGNLKATATSGDLTVQAFSPIAVTNGTIDLQAVAGAVDVQALVTANKTITIQSARGVVLSNAVDTAAAIEATGPDGDVLITNIAQRILVDAPVASLGAAVTITGSQGEIDVRDDLYGYKAVKVTADAALVVNGIVPGIVTVESETGTLELTSTQDSVTAGPNLVIATGDGSNAAVTLTAAKQVNLEVAVTANGAITITSPDQFTVKQALTSNLQAIRIAAAAGPITSVLSPLTAGEAIAITAKNDITLDNTITSTGAGISVTSTEGTVITQPGSVLAAASGNVGDISIDAVTFAMGSHITTGNDITVKTATSFAPVKNFTSNNGSISIAVTNGNLGLVASTVDAKGGSVTLSAAGTVNYGTVATGPGGGFSVTGGGAVAPVGPVVADGNITISTGGAFTPVAGQGLTSNLGNVTVIATQALNVAAISVLAPQGSVSLTSKTQGVTVGATPNLLTVSKTAGSITLAAPMGAVTVGQSLEAGVGIALSSLNGYSSSFALKTTTGVISITTTGAGGAVSIADQIRAGSAIAINTAGTNAPVDVDALLTAGSNITITTAGANAAVDLNAALTAGSSITITTTGAAAWVDVNSAAATLAVVGGDIELNSLADAVKLNAGNPLLSPAGNVTVSSGLDLDVVTPITAVLGNVTLASTAGRVFVKQDLFANPAAGGGTLTINAAGAINNGTAGGVVTTKVTADSFVATAGPLNGLFPRFQFTNPANAVNDLDVQLTMGNGVNFINAVSFNVSGFANATGAVTLESALDVTASVPIATGAGGIAINAGRDISVRDVTASTGSIDLDAARNVVVAGALLSGPTSAIAVTARGGITVTSNMTAGAGIDIDAGNIIRLGATGSPASISTVTNNIVATAIGNIAVVEATVSAPVGSISMTTPAQLSFDGGLLEAALVYNNPPPPALVAGLITLQGLGGIGVTTNPVIRAGRLEIIGGGGGAISLTSPLNDVDTLQVEAGGNFTYSQVLTPLAIDDPDDLANATVQVKSTGGSVSISSTAGLRVVDGIQYNTTLSLVGRTTGNDPGVEFVVTSGGDNPSPPNLPHPFAFAGTLRDMIGYVNANTATGAGATGNTPMRVVFSDSRSPSVVALTATLPEIVKTLTFDGTLAAGTSIVGLDGTAITPPAGKTATSNGLSFGTGSAGSVAENAFIYGFKNAGVQVTSGRNVFRGLTLGEDAAGVTKANGIGILLTGPLAVQNTVGIHVAGDVGNTIVNNGIGLAIYNGANYTSIRGNTIEGNVGAGANDGDGIAVVNSFGTVIGSDTIPLYGNTIAENERHGIFLENVQGTTLAYGATTQGNTISRNGDSGVRIRGGGRNLVGGQTLGARNLIDGNANGVSIVSSLLPTPGNTNHILGNRITASTIAGVSVAAGFGNVINGNIVSGSGDYGILISGATASKTQPANVIVSNTVEGNGNAENEGGIVLLNSRGQAVGVDANGRVLGNTVRDSSGSGVVVVGSATHTGNAVVGNTVTGSAFDGIRVVGTTATTVRQNAVMGKNLNDGRAGIALVDGLAATPAAANVVTANSVGRSSVGIRVAGGRGALIGGTLVADANTIWANKSDGIRVEVGNSTGSASGTVIRNNRVGIAPDSTAAGNAGYGISLQSASGTTVDYANIVRNNAAGGVQVVGGTGTTIGSAVAGRGNTISANTGNGIQVNEPATGTQPVNVTVAGNLIESNGQNGILVSGTRTSSVTIGRAPSIAAPNGTGNTIRNNGTSNGWAGIRVDGSQVVTMIGNSISNNGSGGPIQLLNGANSRILAPTSLRATQRPGTAKAPQFEVRGNVPVPAGRSAGEQVFVDLYMDLSAGGQAFLGRVAARTGGTFRVIVNGPAANGLGRLAIRATATGTGGGLFGDTSAFSAYAT